MKNKLYLILLILSGCSHSSEPCTPIKTTGQIYPLATGNWWVFQHSVFKDLQGSIKYIYYDTITISRDTVITGEKWYYHSWWGFLSNRNDGLWEKRRFGITSDSLITELFFKYPANTYDTIEVDDSLNKEVVLSADTTVSIPYGCYQGYCYSISGPVLKKFVYFLIPAIGMVKGEMWLSDGNNNHWGKTEQWELITANLH